MGAPVPGAKNIGDHYVREYSFGLLERSQCLGGNLEEERTTEG